MEQTESHPLKPTSKVIVKIGQEGVQLQSPSGTPTYKLQFHDLVTLCELVAGDYREQSEVAAAVSNLTGASKDSVVSFLRSLTLHGRLRRRRIPIVIGDILPEKNVSESDNHDFGEDLVALKLPLTLSISDDRFHLVDHDGHMVVSLSPAELVAVEEFAQPTTLADGLSRERELLQGHAVDEAALTKILTRLHAADLLSIVEPAIAEQKSLSYWKVLRENISRQAREMDQIEAQRREQTGVLRTQVIPVAFGYAIPAALGLVIAYSKTYEGGRLDEFYEFRQDWLWDEELAASYTANPAIYLFSNYLWTHEESIAVSEQVKRLSPDSITIHGGPDTPKYAEDGEEYFAQFPHVDIIIRGEGEATAADTLDKLRGVIGQQNPDLSVLKDVPGITYRHRGEILRNPDRARIEDLDTIPSPYLTGLFEVFRGVPELHAALETNRGCPYGCTFCDWGSATTSKIRKFDMDRVLGELSWCSDIKVVSVSQCDANFGVFERDVAIAEHVARLKTTTGYPETFGGSYAKNSTKYLKKIIKVLADAGILAQGVLSLQTMDAGTLSAIKRSNIKVEKYDALANEMRHSNLQLTVELMMGLPGSSLESFIEDLQQCIDRDIQARINHTTLLVNSPMNSPDYRAQHQIETSSKLGPGKMPVLVQTATYSREDMDKMQAFRDLYTLLDNFGVMRLCARFIRQQTGLEETAFYQLLVEKTAAYDKQHQWPMLHILVNYGHDLMAPPYSWALVFNELRRFLVEECGVPDNSALDTIIRAQHALLPAHGRSYPCELELAHDVVSWHAQILAAKAAGHWRDWQATVPPLASFGPGKLVVDDMGGEVTKLLGCEMAISSSGANWDMDSEIARSRVDVDCSIMKLMKRDNLIQVAQA